MHNVKYIDPPVAAKQIGTETLGKIMNGKVVNDWLCTVCIVISIMCVQLYNTHTVINSSQQVDG